MPFRFIASSSSGLNIIIYSERRQAYKYIYIFFLEPNSVTELKASVSGQDVMLSWKPNINSTQDSFYIWYRPILNLSSFWRQTFTRDLQTTLKGMFAGERYEFIVFAVSIGEMSLPRNVFAEVCKYYKVEC